MSIASLQLVGAQYSELNTKLLVRHRQLMSTAGQAFLTQIKELKGETELTDDLVRTRVDQWGFHQQWVDEVESSKKKSSKAKAKATATGPVRQLPELLQPVALPAVPVPANGIVPMAKAAAVPTPAAAVPPAKAGPGPTPRPVLGVPVPSPTAASAVPPVASEMPRPPVASGNPNDESNPDVAAGPTPDEIEADLAEDHPSGSQNPEVESKLLILIAYL